MKLKRQFPHLDMKKRKTILLEKESIKHTIMILKSKSVKWLYKKVSSKLYNTTIFHLEK